MPSPFPGMDPFIEGQAWEDFHTRLIADLSDAVVRAVRPRYIVRIEERVYIENEWGDRTESIRPDVIVLEGEGHPTLVAARATAATAVPVIPTLPIPQRQRETFLTVRERSSMEVVTIVELLSPGNKRLGSEGRREYLRKREAVLRSAVHLVELDLLKAGERLPTIEPLPPADYYAFICRSDARPRAEIYPWSLRQPLPMIPIPLANSDPDVSLDLQVVFCTLYDRAGYDYSLDYRLEPHPSLSADDTKWVTQILNPGS